MAEGMCGPRALGRLVLLGALTLGGAAGGQGVAPAVVMPKVMLNTGHVTPVTQVLLSRDRSLLLSFSTDGATKAWDVASRRQLCQMQDGQTRGTAVALSRSGLVAAVGALEGTIRLWNPRSCQLLGTLRGHTGQVAALQFSRDGNLLLSSTTSRHVDELRAWNVPQLAALPLPDLPNLRASPIKRFIFSDDGRQLVVESNTQFVRLSLPGLQELEHWSRPYEVSGVPGAGLALSDANLVSASPSGNLAIWDLSGRARAEPGLLPSSPPFYKRSYRTLERQLAAISSMAVSAQGDAAYLAGPHGVRRVGLRPPHEQRSLGDGEIRVTALQPSEDGDWLIVALQTGVIEARNTADGRTAWTLQASHSPPRHSAASQDGRVLVVGHPGWSSTELIDTATGMVKETLQHGFTGSESLQLAPDGSRLLLWRAGEVALWDVAERRFRLRTRAHAFKQEGAQFLAGGKQVVTWGREQDNALTPLNIKVWDASSGRLVRTVDHDEKYATLSTVAFDATGERMFSTEQSGHVRVSDLRAGTFKGWSGHRFELVAQGFRFSPDNQRAVSFDNSRIMLWDVQSGQFQEILNNRHTASRILDLAFSPDGTALVSAQADGSVLFWTLGSREPVVALGKHDSAAIGAHFVGKDRVASVGMDGAARLWRPADGAALAAMHLLGSGRSLTMTPDGYFAASDSAAADDVHFVVGDEVLASSVGWDVFHRPDIVRSALAGELPGPGRQNTSFALALRNPPPRVTLAAPAGGAVGARARLAYKLIPDRGGVAELRVFHNGKLVFSDGSYRDARGQAYAPVAGKSEAAASYAATQAQRNATAFVTAGPSGEVPTTLRDQLVVRGAPEKKCTPGQPADPCAGEIEIDVIPGEENTVTVVAFNRDNTIQSVPASVSFRSTLPPQDPRLFVLAVGIDQFKGVSPLMNARKDAQDFACTYAGREALARLGLPCAEDGRARTLFKPGNVHVVQALFDQAATKAGILKALGEVAAQARPGDTFVWFVASHGMMDANSLFGIVAHDTQCLNGPCTEIAGHITSNEILEASKRIKAMKQLVVLDTCHAGGLDNKLSGLYDARVSLLARNMGLHLYASAQATEQAQDGKPGTNGVFTAQLLEGIRGAAPKNELGQISVMTLGPWARQKTIAATTPVGNAVGARAAQTPVIQHFGQDAGLAAGR